MWAHGRAYAACGCLTVSAHLEGSGGGCGNTVLGGSRMLQSRLDGRWVFVQTSLPIRACRVGGRGRAGSAGWGLGCHLRVRALSQGTGARARWEGSPSSPLPPPPPVELKSCACALVLRAARRGWARAGPLYGRGGVAALGAPARASCWVWSPPARAPAARRRGLPAPVWAGGGGLASCRGAASGPAFAFYGNNATGLGFLCPPSPSLGARPLAARGRDLPEVGRAAAAAPGGPAVTTALFCAFVVRHG